MARSNANDPLAQSQTKQKSIYGGVTPKETYEHFALRFSASVVRVQNVLLDTQAAFGAISLEVLQSFSSHSISILDIPCGTGAGALALLSIIHELRLAGLVPCLPLNVTVQGGDFSECALEIYRDLFNDLRSVFALSGIKVTLHGMHWDATDLASTNQLFRTWERASLEAHERFVLISNFSGDGSDMDERLDESMRHICVRAAAVDATLLWIEPGDKGGKGFLARMSKAIRKFFFGKESEEKHEPRSSEAKWWHEINGVELNIRSAVHNYSRVQ